MHRPPTHITLPLLELSLGKLASPVRLRNVMVYEADLYESGRGSIAIALMLLTSRSHIYSEYMYETSRQLDISPYASCHVPRFPPMY